MAFYWQSTPIPCLCLCLTLSISLLPQLQLEKQKGEILGIVIVESGWGSILPTVILANMMNGGPAARSGKLSIGDQIMSINNTSLVGLPLATCQESSRCAEGLGCHSAQWAESWLGHESICVILSSWLLRVCGLGLLSHHRAINKVLAKAYSLDFLLL